MPVPSRPTILNLPRCPAVLPPVPSTDALDPVAYHEALAADWDRRYQRGSFARRACFFARKILPLLPPAGHWLDAGCGTGTFSRMLAADNRTVLGVDASVAMVEEGRRLAEPLGGRAAFEPVATVESLPFPDASFDGVICLSVLEYLAKPQAALDELARVLRPGGVVVVSVPHRHSAVRALQRAMAAFRQPRQAGGVAYLALSRFSVAPTAFADMAADAGLTVSARLGFDPVVPGAMQVLVAPSLLYFVCRKASVA
ncbi:MAG: hypothetical protein B7Y70_14405 [Rhizobiales bacterium 35-68-8]|nr:MAG: hypothetical protein B7Y70_14405 [Rhizobiales bacterium 35-68-8]